METPRWRATIYYRADDGVIDVAHDVEELGEIQDLVERGPHWDTVDRIEIRLQRPAQDATLTIETAARM